MDVGQLLQNTFSTDNHIREESQKQLEQFAASDIGAYLCGLAAELKNEAQIPDVRQAAGLIAKNALTARDASTRQDMQMRWRSLNNDIRQRIREDALQALHSSDNRAGTASAQLISAIAATDLPHQEWPALLDILTSYVLEPSSSQNLRISALQAIGYICESTDGDVLANHANKILTAVIHGSRSNEQGPEVQYVGLDALFNSLDFCHDNFDREVERNMIMQTVCEATQSPVSKVQVKAFECLVEIMHLYYDQMVYYMEQALFILTTNGMRSGDDHVVLQAIEFWSTVCEEENMIAEEALDAQEAGMPPERQSHQFAIRALDQILPDLLNILTKQDEDAEEGDWNPSMASATCIDLLARNVEDRITPTVIKFIEEHISSADWRHREAAVMAFGSILNGPSEENLSPLVMQALPLLITMLTDDAEARVKDTTAWTLGRICETLSDCVQPESHLVNLMRALLTGLRDEVKIASSCAWAINNLSQHLGAMTPESDTSAMSVYFDSIVDSLLGCSQREEVVEENLLFGLCSALSTVIETAAMDCVPKIPQLLEVLLRRLAQSIEKDKEAVSTEEKMVLDEEQGALVTTIGSCIRRLNRDSLVQADAIMATFLQICANPNKQTIHEEVFLSILALLNAIGSDFSRYMSAFAPILANALRHHQEHELCNIAVGFVGDLTRSIEAQVSDYIPGFMELLFTNLQSGTLHRDVKPHILSCLGDIALAIGAQYEPYYAATMDVLQGAGSVQADPNDDEMVYYLNSLRDGVAEAYVGLVQGLKAERPQLIVERLPAIVHFMQMVVNDEQHTEELIKANVGLLGDLASAVPTEMKQVMHAPWIKKLIDEALKSTDKSTKETARWARQTLREIAASG